MNISNRESIYSYFTKFIHEYISNLSPHKKGGTGALFCDQPITRECCGHPFPMPPSKKKTSAKGTPKLTAAHNFLPLLTKPAEVMGERIRGAGQGMEGLPSRRQGEAAPLHRTRHTSGPRHARLRRHLDFNMGSCGLYFF